MNTKPNILVVGYNDSPYARPFYGHGNVIFSGDPWYRNTECIKDLDMMDIVVFTGGADINPLLYGEPKHPSTSPNKSRDDFEVIVAEECFANHIPTVGICRGAQLLNVLAGGKLWQNVEHHNTPHLITTRSGRKLPVNSIHHQMMRVGSDALLLAWTHVADEYEHMDDKGIVQIVDYEYEEPEVVYYPKQRALCVQFHPEMLDSHSPGWAYFQDIFKVYILDPVTNVLNSNVTNNRSIPAIVKE